MLTLSLLLLFHPLYQGVVVVYLDEILIFTEILKEHQRVTRRVMELLQKNNLFLKPEKCKFEKTEDRKSVV